MITKFINSAATTNAQVVKAAKNTAAVAIWSMNAFNAGAGAAFVKLYNKATAPVVGTDTPVLVLPVGAGALTYLDVTQGIQFTAGLAIAITGAAADSDTTAVAANQVKVSFVING